MIQTLLNNFQPQDYMILLTFIAMLIAIVVGCSSYPAIINVAQSKQLMDVSDERSSHSGIVPNLGGIGMYLSIMVAMTLMGAILDTKSLLLILGGITILFFLGLKDDILVLSPRKKFLGQLLAAILLIVFTDSRIHGLSGLFGVTIMPYIVSVIFTLFVYVLIINAINLIDGIDGLAGGIALLASTAFGYLFYQQGDFSMVVLAAATGGAIIPFLFYNFSKRRKMFMGDTGSMILGFIISVFVVRFIDTSENTATALYSNSAPIIAMSVLFFPLLDTIRIFLIRLVILRKSPFAADKNHIHHRFLGLGFSHAQTSAMLIVMNALLIVFTYLCRDLDIHFQLALLLLSGCVLFSVYFLLYWLRSFHNKRVVEAHNF